jgi:hypothetical protein
MLALLHHFSSAKHVGIRILPVHLLFCSSLLIEKEEVHMPPQVNGPGPGKRPAAVHSHDGVDQTKSGNVNKKPAENQQDTTIEPHRATSKEKSQKKLEMSMGSSWLTDLARALGEVEGKQAEKVKTKAEKVKTNPKDLEKIEDMKANSQQLSIISGAVNEAVKTIGNAIDNAAKKQ